eukprot:1145631-Pelagomonas_calceolata.AAC.4
MGRAEEPELTNMTKERTRRLTMGAPVPRVTAGKVFCVLHCMTFTWGWGPSCMCAIGAAVPDATAGVLTHGTAQQAPLLSHKSKLEGRAEAVCPRGFMQIAHYHLLQGGCRMSSCQYGIMTMPLQALLATSACSCTHRIFSCFCCKLSSPPQLALALADMYPTVESKMRDKAAAKAAAEGRDPEQELHQQQQTVAFDQVGPNGPAFIGSAVVLQLVLQLGPGALYPYISEMLQQHV